jgi:hypothetical protein
VPRRTFHFELTVLPAAERPAVVRGVYPGTGHSGETLEFYTLQGSGGVPVAWSWDFGGGAAPDTSTARAPQVTLAGAGSYSASVTVTTAQGVPTTFLFELAVSAPGAPLPPRLYGVRRRGAGAHGPGPDDGGV